MQGGGIIGAEADLSTCQLNIIHLIRTISERQEGPLAGPDLSTYGSAMAAEAILKAIVNPARITPFGFRPATVTTRDGTQVEGVVRNEDNFSVQLQTKDGSFVFLQKSDVQILEYSGKSMTPANYADRLSQSELNDLISILMNAGSPSKPTSSKQP